MKTFTQILHESARSWKQALELRLKKSGLSQAGWLTVAAVVQASHPLSQTELSRILGVQTATMVPMIDRLIKAGLIERLASEHDRRINYISSTKAGRDLYKKIQKQADILREEITAEISAEDLKIATSVLEKIQKASEAIA